MWDGASITCKCHFAFQRRRRCVVRLASATQQQDPKADRKSGAAAIAFGFLSWVSEEDAD